jgi:hypothetical protein
VRIFAFVAAQKADFPVRRLCRVCKVSASGFYAYAARLAAGPGPAAAARAVTAPRSPARAARLDRARPRSRLLLRHGGVSGLQHGFQRIEALGPEALVKASRPSIPRRASLVRA